MTYKKILISAKYKVLSEMVIKPNENLLFIIEKVTESFLKEKLIKKESLIEDLKIDLFDFFEEFKNNNICFSHNIK